MKKVVLRFRAVDQDIFEAIKNGTKKVETRAATEKFSSLVVGDMLVLTCGGGRFEKRISKATHFNSLGELFDTYEVGEVLPAADSLEEARKIYHSFPGYEAKIKKYGIMALELEQ